MDAIDETWWTRVLAGPGGTLTDGGSDERYVVLPNRADPRVVVDRANAMALRDALERFVSSRSANEMLRGVAGLGAKALTRTKGRWGVSAREDGRTLRECMSEVLGESVRLSIAVGPPRPNRKPVIRCYSNERLVAVAKLGPDAHTSAMVDNEGEWLDRLADDPLDGVSTPSLIHAGAFEGSALLVMEAMELESDLGIPFDEVPIAVPRQLRDRFSSADGLAASPWWRELLDRLATDELSSMAELARRLEADGRFDDLSVSAWHGDWSPWNMGRSPNGDLYVWDWERALVGVPTGFDLAHLHYQYGDGLDAAARGLDQLGVTESQHGLLNCLYLLEVCARHADAGSLETERHASAVRELERQQRLAGVV